MTVRAFTGGAGCGKTFQLMDALERHLAGHPLGEGQKVLGLTFMHGSRRRLDQRLREVPLLSGRYDCSTLDGFAWRIARRWQSLVEQLGYGGLRADDFARVIEAAAAVLEMDVVCRWVSTAFPVLVVDEAQDLTIDRLRIISALSTRLEVLAAADEFQCLDEGLRPNPACAWLANAADVQDLVAPRRTNVPELLGAATALRMGNPPQSGTLLKVQLASNAALAGTWLCHNLAWYGGGRKVAVISPVARPYAVGVVEWVRTHTTSRGLGPYFIRWEHSDGTAAETYLRTLPIEDGVDIPQIEAAVRAAGDYRVAADVIAWLDTQRRACGKATFGRSDVEQVVRQSFSARRRWGMTESNRFGAMTVHGAKNREFDNVVILWPAATIGSDDQKRRLLYNAITRAKERCLILVQAQSSLTQPPFV